MRSELDERLSYDHVRRRKNACKMYWSNKRCEQSGPVESTDRDGRRVFGKKCLMTKRFLELGV